MGTKKPNINNISPEGPIKHTIINIPVGTQNKNNSFVGSEGGGNGVWVGRGGVPA